MNENIGLEHGKKEQINEKTNLNRTIFVACPNFPAVLKAVFDAAKQCNVSKRVITILGQVDLYKYNLVDLKVFLRDNNLRKSEI